jgi:hypothetical protein
VRIPALLSVAAIALAIAGGEARAATLYTPSIEGGSASSGVTCTAVNVSTRTRNIGIEIKDDAGSSNAAQALVPVDPGKGLAIDDTTAGGPARYCVITVQGGKKTVRGAIYVREGGNSVGSLAAQ